MPGTGHEVLDIRLFGPLRLSWDGRDARRPARRDVRLVLIWLLLHRGQRHPRRAVADALWPDVPEPSALARLRRSLYRLHATLPPAPADRPWIRSDEAMVSWNPAADCRIDAATFDRLVAGCCRPVAGGDPAVRRAELDEALAMAADDLVAGDDADWLAPYRAHYAGRVADLLEQQADVCAGLGDLSASVAAVERLLELEPLHERAVRRQMDLLCRLDLPGCALRTYERFRDALLAEVEADPQPETVALADAIHAGRLAGRTRAGAAHDLAPPERALLARLADIDRCVSLQEAIGLAKGDIADADPRVCLLALVDQGLVVVCPGSGHRMSYRVSVDGAAVVGSARRAVRADLTDPRPAGVTEG